MGWKLFLILALFIPVVETHAIGTGFSIFFPEAGTPSIEQSVTAELTLIKKYLSFPVGVNFNKISGIKTLDIVQSTEPWFYADCLQLFLHMKVNIPFGDHFFISFFGGGNINWNLHLEAKTGNIDRDLAAYYNYSMVSSDLTYQAKTGFGFEAGGSMGLRINRLTFDLTVSYVDIKHTLVMSGDYHYADQSGTVGTAAFDIPNARLSLKGFKIGFNIDYAL